MDYLIVFLIISFLGWIIETIFRSIIEEKKLINPGFLKGPYLPIYGFGGITLFILSKYLIGEHIIYSIFAFFISLTFIELITGLIFENYFKIKLWDYSKQIFNYKGIICLEFSLYWTFLGLVFQKYLYPLFSKISTIELNTYLIFGIGIIYGIIFTDTFSSFEFAYKIKKMSKELRKDIKEKIKNHIVHMNDVFNEFRKFNYERHKNKRSIGNLFPIIDSYFRISDKNLKHNLENFIQEYKERKINKK